MALQKQTIVFNVSNSELGLVGSGAGSAKEAFAYIQKKAKKEIAKKISASLLGPLSFAAWATGAIAVINQMRGKSGFTIRMELTPKKVTKVQQGTKYTFEKYDLTHFSIKSY